MLIERRSLLRGLFATPAIVAVDSLMPLRGERLIIDPAARWNGKYFATVEDAIEAACKGCSAVATAYARAEVAALYKAGLYAEIRRLTTIDVLRLCTWSRWDEHILFPGDLVVASMFTQDEPVVVLN